jgi:hypothetical protein
MTCPLRDLLQNGLLPDRQIPLSRHIAERFTFMGICQLLEVVGKASESQAEFTLCEEANDDRFFGAARRAAGPQIQRR